MKTLIIIGAGLAGLAAANTAAKQGTKAILVSSYPSERAQSVMAAGGINAALDTKGEQDSPLQHYEDTFRSAAGLTDKDAVRNMCEAAPGIVLDLYKRGVQFSTTKDGRIDLRNFGGQKKKRTAYARSGTGKQIMTAMIDETRKHELSGKVERYPHHDFITLLLSGKNCGGAVIKDRYTGETVTVSGDGVIMCAGGFHGLFAGTTGNSENTGSATAELFRLGAEIANAEMIQYHPTCTALSAGKRRLISESARGEGGRLFTLKAGKRVYFMEEKYPELGNLMPRDVTSREIWRELKDGPVFLDISFLPAEVLKVKLAEIVDICRLYMGLDASREPIPVEPGIHYFMGGLRVNSSHKVIGIENLYAAGECCAMYHGANRLGGNSLLGAIFGGMTAAKTACESAQGAKGALPVSPMPTGPVNTVRELNGKALGVIRDESTLRYALSEMEKLPGSYPLLSAAMLKCAIARRESRGAHYREDFPEKDIRFASPTRARFANDHLEVTFENEDLRQ